MLTIPTAALLRAWEQGHDASSGERGLILLRAACPDVPAEMLAGWPVGKRDAALLKLFERLFGNRLAAQAECPRCNAPLEMDFPVSTISAPALDLTSDQFDLECAGYRVTYRLPTAGDLAVLADPAVVAGDEQTRVKWLLRQCVLRVAAPGRAGHTAGEPAQNPQAPIEQIGIAAEPSDVPGDEIVDVPDELTAAIEAAISRTVTSVDPLAQIELNLNCPACAFSWQSPFDIVSFLWSEVDDWAKQMLREIHILASNYGWSESEIVALSPQRRRHYRGLIGI